MNESKLHSFIRQACGIFIRGIRVRIPQKLDVAVFESWNLDVVAFRTLKKCLGIKKSWLSCLRFSIS